MSSNSRVAAVLAVDATSEALTRNVNVLLLLQSLLVRLGRPATLIASPE